MRRRSVFAGLLLLLPAGIAQATSSGPVNPGICEQAGAEAERSYGLPSGMLVAIGRVESGRWDAARRRIVPWPWSVGTPTAGNYLDNKDDAIATVRRLRASGASNIDVGCFQINLGHHPKAFQDMEQAFDPFANARYAASFLSTLQTRLGNWNSAIESYHSADLSRSIPYRRLVQASWTASPETASPASDQPYLRFGIRIWTPSGTMAGSHVAPAVAGLPRIIVPGR